MFSGYVSFRIITFFFLTVYMFSENSCENVHFATINIMARYRPCTSLRWQSSKYLSYRSKGYIFFSAILSALVFFDCLELSLQKLFSPAAMKSAEFTLGNPCSIPIWGCSRSYQAVVLIRNYFGRDSIVRLACKCTWNYWSASTWLANRES